LEVKQHLVTLSISNKIGNHSILINQDDEKITILRRPQGKYVSGRHVLGVEETFEAFASVQPITGVEILQISEGDRKRSHFKIYTTFQVEDNDVVIHDGKRYEVRKAENWDTYTKAVIVLEDIESGKRG